MGGGGRAVVERWRLACGGETGKAQSSNAVLSWHSLMEGMDCARPL